MNIQSNQIALDASQRAVATAACDERQFVLAAAGQGKTEVLLARASSLVDDGLNPADEILVLSFSRAAVEAVRKRSGIHDLDGLQIRTFDAFATQILLDEEDLTEVGLPQGFDHRIRKATDLINGADFPDRLYPLKHILIDEAQDIVGDRAEFVLALISALGDEVGFTVLGDPLQGIYDFQLQGSVSKRNSSEFLQALINDFDVTETQLTRHYRATSDRTKELIKLGETIRGMGVLDDLTSRAAHQLLDNYRMESSSSSLLNLPGMLEPFEGDTTALLCSTNYEVLIASELLWENGYSHVVRRKTQDMSIAPWVYEIFKDLEDRTYNAQDIKEKLLAASKGDADDQWIALKTAEGDSRAWDSLNVSRLSQRLRSRSVPLALTVNDSAPLTLSTVHRSKGLEFTNVLYVQPPAGAPAAKEDASALRQKYVALSRAREDVVSTKLLQDSSARPVLSDGRWLEKRFGKFGQYTARMEFINSDIDDMLPFESDEIIAETVQDNLVLERLLGKIIFGAIIDNDSEIPNYKLLTEDNEIIGKTSDSFGYGLKKSFAFKNRRNWTWPRGFSGGRVISIECATGHPEYTKSAGLGTSGMWLVPRLSGLITPTWK